MGRLGNNMFQIATAYALASDNNDKAEFYLHSDLPHLPKRSIEPIYEYIAPDNTNPILDIEYKKDMTLVGFFQRHEHFDKYKEQLIKEVFQVPEDWQPNTIAIHVRRGDFLFDPINFPVITNDYINQAIDLIGRDKKIVFCSDDINFCQLHFRGENIKYRINTSPMSDICFMANCDNVIMSNSTFSFWGAYLSMKKRKIVFPLNWFAKNSGRDGYEICPKEWIGI